MTTPHPAHTVAPDERRTARRVIVALIAAVSALLVTCIVLVTLVASSAPAPPAPAPDPAPAFTGFSPGTGTSAGCADEFDSHPITFSWSSRNAHSAWIGISTQNAQQAPYSEVPVNGSITLYYQCSNASELYTVTLAGDHGLSHKTVTVTR